MLDQLDLSLQKIQRYIQCENFKGYDPYDVLNSPIPFHHLGKWPPILAVQLLKRLPVNLRPLLGIKKGINPKAMGLFLEAYSFLSDLYPDQGYEEHRETCFQWLSEHPSNGYSGPCWGYNFDWASPVKTVKAYTPSIVVSGFIAKGIFEYNRITQNPQALELLQGVCDFILKDLPRTESAEGICFSYTPLMQDYCYNASMLGAEVLVKVYSLTGNTDYLELARSAVDFCVAHQHPDGRWNYSIDLETGRERQQIDFHQGYVLDSLYEFMRYSGLDDEKYGVALKKGADYYKNQQFFSDGRSLWRVPKQWPVQIHNQSQGIITFSRLKDLDPSYLPFAETIAQWTLEHIQHPKYGYFYYEKRRFYTNKIPYMRWSQAWMMLALTRLLAASESETPSKS
ncbi:hypothetical protein GF406_19030 [candidate division KSB1 bacterium]|nr:hypothetical protein [candidate division KSB1 bacterium]